MKPALSVSLVSAAVITAGALVYRLGRGRCVPCRAAAGSGSVADHASSHPPPLAKPTEAVQSLLDRLRVQGL